MMRMHFMFDNLGYKHTLSICNNYCFFTATMVARTCFKFMTQHPLHASSRNTATRQCYPHTYEASPESKDTSRVGQ